MTQHNDILHEPISMRYNRTDFTALRSWMSGLDLDFILDRYYPFDERDLIFPNGAADLGKKLSAMREDLIDRLCDARPHAVKAIAEWRKLKTWSKSGVDFLYQGVDAKAARPRPDDPVTSWFKPIAAKRLKAEGIKTMADLIDVIGRRGRGWYMPIPCLGAGKARKIESWLLANQDYLPALPYFVGKPASDLPQAASVKILERHSRMLMPMERFLPASELSGTQGCNRHHQRPLISARNDYDAIQAYLYKYRGQDKTWQAYRKELERFLLWCICECGKAMSDLLVDDCEAYKDFLANPPERWVGTRQTRHSPVWKPFTSPTLSPESQWYAIKCIRTCFAWLVDVRYLSANPFVAIQNPIVAQQIHRMQIHKALSRDLWNKLSRPDGILDELCSLSEQDILDRFNLRLHSTMKMYAPQLVALRAIVLLLGATGIRREELAFASRKHLQPYPNQPGIWQLAVQGKRRKWRYVYPSSRDIEAIRAHWADRGEDFDVPRDVPLLSPVHFPATVASQIKHTAEEPGSKGYSVKGIYNLVRSWFTRIANDETFALTPEERDTLASAGIHAFRHTFGTLTVADNMPIDVVQGLLGHASLNTTTIYVRSTEDRAAAEIGKWRSGQKD